MSIRSVELGSFVLSGVVMVVALATPAIANLRLEGVTPDANEPATNFDQYVLAMLSEADERTLRMTQLAAQTNAALPRLSHVVRRLEERGLVERLPCPDDRRATNAHLTDDGLATLESAAPGHVANVRAHVVDALSPEQVEQLGEIADALLARLDPTGGMTAMYRRHDAPDD